MPTVSICMPAFNVAAYVDEAIESVLGQTFRDYEFLILDDGSTDGTLSQAEAYARRDTRIQVRSFEHRGYAPLLNEGLGLARGKYYARMDADDTVAPERLERQVTFLEANQECVAVGTQALFIDSDGDPLGPASHPLEHAKIDAGLMGGRFQMTHASLVMRTEVVRGIGGYTEEFEPGEDFDLLLRLAEAGKLANLPDYLYRYRQHPRQATVERYAVQQWAMREAIARAGQRRGVAVSHTPFVHQRPNLPWQVHVVWAECAERAGYPATAQKHALRALKLRPWSRTAWRVCLRVAVVRLWQRTTTGESL